MNIQLLLRSWLQATPLAKYAFLIILMVFISRLAEAKDTIGVWERWEYPLKSDLDYANPCKDVAIHVRFEGPTGQKREGMGFWDGERTFRIRNVFPTPGIWKWSTTCSDNANSGLHNQSGFVKVTRNPGRDPLTKHGYLQVSDDGRLLVHADKTPFLWIGDTCWAAPVHATDKEWKTYVTNRLAKGYSVLQVSIAPEWALERAKDSIPPFLSVLPDITKPNPRFFQALDHKLALANDSGLVVMMCGLMETPYRYPPTDQIPVLARYVAARYNAFAVLFSPSFDSGIHKPETLAAANAIHEAAPESLITMHMGTGAGPHFHAADWLSFDMFQSGHNGGDKKRQSELAIKMPAEILSLTPRKPIINGEAIYEGDLGGAYDVRRTAWLSFLSGAMGYTAGINQVYGWEEDAVAKMNVPSSDQVALLGRILRAVPWWQLEPAPALILNQPENPAKWVAFALTTDKKLGIGYLPANESICLNLQENENGQKQSDAKTGMYPLYEVLWISPISGEWHKGTTITPSQKTELKAPDSRDWIVLLADLPVITNIIKALNPIPLSGNKSKATITFSKDAPVDGLVQKAPEDGKLIYTIFKGVECLVNEKPKRNNYLYIDVDDRLAFRGGPKLMSVQVRMQSSESLDGVRLQYDAVGPDEESTIYKHIEPTRKQESNGWTILDFTAETPYLGNRQNSGADFRLFLDGRLCNVASITVTLINPR